MARTVLTKQDLIQALAELETRLTRKFATKDYLVAMEQRTEQRLAAMGTRTDEKLAGVEARLGGQLATIESRLKDYVHEGVDTVVKALDEMDKKHNQRFDKLEQELKTVHRRLLGLEHDTVSKKEFAELKSRIDAHLSYN